MATTDTQQTAQFAAEAAVSAAEAKQYLIEVQQGYQDISATTQEAINAATAAEASKVAAETAEQNSSASAVASSESATAAAGSAAQAEEYANNASDYAQNKFTFYKTASDPDGTIAGLAATTEGQSFWVAQGPDALSAAWQYQNVAGVAVLQAKQPGTAAITGTIREFPTLAAAQADADAGNIQVGSTAYYRNPDDSALAIEVINNAGTLTATGRKMPSQFSVDGSRLHADAIIDSRILPANTAIAAQVDNDLNTVKHIFNVLQQSISAAVSSILCPQRSAFIINSMSNANAVGVPGGLTAKVAGVVTYQNTILPGESVAVGLKTTPYAWKDLTGIVPSGVIFDTSVVRIIYTFTLENQIRTTDGYNVQDKSGRFAASTQTAAPGVSVSSVSSHSGGGIQLAVPNSVITGAGFTLNDAGVKAWLNSLWPLSFYCLTSVTQGTENFVDFTVFEAGQFSLEVASGITFSGGVYSSRIPPLESVAGDLSLSSSLAGYTKQLFSGDLSDANGIILNDTAALFINEVTTNGVMGNVNGVTISKDGSAISTRYFPGASTFSGGKMTSLYKPFRMSDLAIQTLVAGTTGMMRAVYFLPAGFGGLVYDYNVPVCVDLSGAFYPVTAGNAASVTQRSVGGHTENNKVQFVLTIAEITAAGYNAYDKYDVDRYLRKISINCQFVSYTGSYQTFAIDSSLLGLKLQAGAYTFSYISNFGLKGKISGIPPERNLEVGAYSRMVADIKNSISQNFTNYPMEIRTSFSEGQVPSSDCLVLIDSDGTEYPCQFADEFHCNNRQLSDMGYHADGSLKDGSVFFMGNLASGERKYLELKQYNRSVRSYNRPDLVRSGRDYTVTVDGWIYTFKATNQYQLASITDPSGVSHAVSTQLYMVGLISNAYSQTLFDYKPTMRLISSGPVFTEVETILFNSLYANVPAGSLRARIRTRMFRNGKCQVYTQVTAVSQIAVGLLFGVFTKCTMGDAAYSFDNNLLTAVNTDSQGKNWSVTLVRANGDTHRDGTAYGPNRPIFASYNLPTSSTTGAYAGWAYSNTTDYSFLNWPVKKDWTWTSEFWIDANDTLTDKAAIASKVHNRPAGHFGNSPYPSVLRQYVLDESARHVMGSMLWWHSADATPYGGGTYGKAGSTIATAMYHSYTADLMNLLAYGKGDFDTIYGSFKTYLSWNWASLATIGNAYTSGSLLLQFASRLVIPVLEWMYYLAVKKGDSTKVSELQVGIKSFADALVSKFNSLGGLGIPLSGAASDIGNSNSNAVSMRAIALAIYAGQDDVSGSYLTAYNSLEALLTSRTGYMRVEGIITDGNGGSASSLGQGMYLHYQAYATNAYLFAEKMLNRTPVFDLVNFTLLATGGMGGFREIDYCISESRRGSANTISFAMFGLLLSESASGGNAAAALLDKFKSEYGPKPGFPIRFFGFDGATAAGNYVTDVSFVGTTLADIWLYYYFN
ncbi:hypothetical protein J0X08_00711 [Klebsiella variicola]|nr:hypothetical protein [Klebsiella variicola]